MEDGIRLIITILFIGLVVLTIVFFGIFGIAPLTRLNTVLKASHQSTSSVAFPDISSGGNTPVSTSSSQTPSVESPQTTAGNPTSTPPSETQNSGTSSGGAVTSPGPVKFITQSSPISESQIPSGAIRLTDNGNGFVPPIIQVTAGSVFTIAFVSGNDETHVFKFDDSSLASIGLGVGPHEIRTITLSIPNPGKYPFHCDVPGHTSRGEIGEIVVQ